MSRVSYGELFEKMIFGSVLLILTLVCMFIVGTMDWNRCEFCTAMSSVLNEE